MTKVMIVVTALSALSLSANAQTGGLRPPFSKIHPSQPTALGRRLAETTCSACHQIEAAESFQSPKSGAPSFVDISRRPSTNELEIKFFLRSLHPTMPNIILTRKEIDSVAAYIVSLARK
jgi:mono/diheme cytochrome c family protein